MGGVSIPAYTVEADGVKWTASWDDGGHISYKGVDKDGKEVSSAAPSDVIKAARDYGAGFGGKDGDAKDGGTKDSDGKTAGDFKDSCDGLVIETNKDGTLKSANIPEADWTPRQREFVEKCLKAAAMSGKSDNKEQGGKDNKNEEISRILKENGADRVSYSSKDGKVTFLDKDGKEISVSKEDMAKAEKFFRDTAGNNNRCSLKEELKASFKQIAKGYAETVEMMKEPFGLAKDLYKAGKLIGQGKFRELRDRAALKIHDNVEAMGLLSDNMQKRINEANKRIEERLGIENREKNPSIIAKMQGRSINALKRLSGRTGVQSVKSVKGKDTGKGLSR